MEVSTVVVAVPVYISGQDSEKISNFRQALLSIPKHIPNKDVRLKVKTLVIDDESPTTEVENICLELRQQGLQLDYLRRRRSSTEARGPSGALNSALKYLFEIPDTSRMEKSLLTNSLRDFTHFCFVHADDTLTAESIEARVSEFHRQQNAGVKIGAVYGGLRVYCNSETRTFTYYDFKNFTLLKIYMFLSDYFPDHTMMWSRDFLKDIVSYCFMEYKNFNYKSGDFFDIRFSYMEDTDASMISAQVADIFGYKITAVSQTLYNYFDAGDGSLSDGEFIYGTEAYNNRVFAQNLISEKHFPGFPGIFRHILRNLKIKNVLIEPWKGDVLLKFCDTLMSKLLAR